MQRSDESPDLYECSILLPLRDGVKETRACFEALVRATTGVAHEVILVDDGTTDETAQLLADLSGDVRIVRNEKPTSFAAAYNAAAKLARSPWLVLLRQNTLPTARWLESLLRCARRTPKAAVIGSKIVGGAGGVHHAGVVFSRENRLPYHVYERLAADAPEVNRTRELQAVTAPGSLVSRAVFEALGGFDEAFHDGYEDVDFCLRVRAAGHHVVYEPRSTLMHRELRPRTTAAQRGANRDRLLARWKGCPLADEDIVFVSDGYARIYTTQGGETRTTLRRFDNDDERHRYAQLALAERHATNGDRTAVLAALRDDAHWPEDAAARKWAGVLAHWAGDAALAERYWITVLDQADAPELRAALARACLMRGELDAGKRHIDVLLARVAGDPDGWFLRGVHALSTDDFVLAQSAFESALLNGAEPRRALMGQGFASYHAGDAELAFDVFAAVVSDHPDDGEALNWLIRAAATAGRMEDLREVLTARVARNETDVAARFALGAAHVRLGELRAARSQYDAIRKRAPEFAGLADLERTLGSAAPIRPAGTSGAAFAGTAARR